MAKKKAASQKTASDPAQEASAESAKTATAESPATPASSRSKASDEQSSDSGIGVADIKKAVAFSNSVGGLEKATALLQILKVAKDVQ